MAEGKTRGRKLAHERERLLAELVADEWPLRQIQKTHGFNFSTIKRLHPEYTGMTQREGGKLSWQIRQTETRMNDLYGATQLAVIVRSL